MHFQPEIKENGKKNTFRDKKKKKKKKKKQKQRTTNIADLKVLTEI